VVDKPLIAGDAPPVEVPPPSPATTRRFGPNKGMAALDFRPTGLKRGSLLCRPVRQKQTLNLPQSHKASSATGVGRRETGLSSSTQSVKWGSRQPMVEAQTQRETPMPPTTSADDTLIAAHLASGILAATMRVASVENPAAQAPLAAKLYFDCHDALRAERKRRYEV
jgi:hypothetical protein